MTRTRAELADAEWRYTRHLAETVDCPHDWCGAQAGETCRYFTDGQPLNRLPAHSARIRKARETP